MIDINGSTGDISIRNDFLKTGVHSFYGFGRRGNDPGFDVSQPVEVRLFLKKIGMIPTLSFNLLVMLYH